MSKTSTITRKIPWKEIAEENQRHISFLVNLLTEEQDCRWTHYIGGDCTWEDCPHEEEDE